MQRNVGLKVLVSAVVFPCVLFVLLDTFINRSHKEMSIVLPLYSGRESNYRSLVMDKIGNGSVRTFFANVKGVSAKGFTRMYEYLYNWERKLVGREAVLSAMNANINARMLKLKKAREKIGSLLDTANTGARVDRLGGIVSICESMPAYEMAKVFEIMDPDTALYIASNLPRQRLSLILSHMDQNEAVKMVTRLSTVIRSEAPVKH